MRVQGIRLERSEHDVVDVNSGEKQGHDWYQRIEESRKYLQIHESEMNPNREDFQPFSKDIATRQTNHQLLRRRSN